MDLFTEVVSYSGSTVYFEEVATSDTSEATHSSFLNDNHEYTSDGYSSRNPFSYDVIYAVIVCVGVILNSIILRCYWRMKSATAICIRAFAIFDITVMALVTISQLIYHLFADLQWLQALIYFVRNAIGNASMLGPLFLALDRYLIVAFPHNFRKHEKKLRWMKIWLGCLNVGLFTTSYAMNLNNIPFSMIANLLTHLLFFTMLAASVILYTVIVVKVLTSDKKMQHHRHFGKIK